MADPHEARGEHVHEKATDELDRIERHDSPLTSVGIVLPAEGYLAILETHQAAVADGRLVGVPGQVFQDRGGSFGRPLGMHDPFGLHRLGEQTVELCGVGQRQRACRGSEADPVGRRREVPPGTCPGTPG